MVAIDNALLFPQRLFSVLKNDFDMFGFSYPSTNIVEYDKGKYKIEMSVPGFNENEIEVTRTQNLLHIKGETKKENEEVNEKYLKREFRKESFERTFELSDDIEIEQAELKNGILTIYLHKIIPENKKPIKINIKSE